MLVSGLLLLGLVAEREGVFRLLGARLERLPGPPVVLVAASLGAVAAVTAVLNLDTAVVFVTPVVIHAAVHRGLDPRPVAYGALAMANAASLLLPGANLTNLIVRADAPSSGGSWMVDVAPAGVAAAAVTLAILLLLDRRAWSATVDRGRPSQAEARPFAGGSALAVGAAVALAGAAIVLLPRPALPVLLLGLLTAGVAVARSELRPRDAIRALGPGVLIGLFLLVCALGWLAREWQLPGEAVAGSGPLATAAIGALAAVLLNNLPAAALLGASHPPHPEALLVGLNLGPNLFVTGSLSAYLWWRACSATGVAVTLRGLMARAPATVAPAILAAVLLLPG